jgi:hypothetical protein
MKGHGSRFGKKIEEAVMAMLTHRNLEDAAKAVGIGEATLLRWQKQPEFQLAFREARRAVFSQAIARMQQASNAAVSTMLKIMVDANAAPSTRLRAADNVLSYGLKAIEFEDIEVRVAELERNAEMNARSDKHGKR